MSADKAKGVTRLGIVLAAAAGLVGTGYLIFYVGIDAVIDATLSVGWTGFALLWLYGAANIALLGIAWFLIVPPHASRYVTTFIWGRAVRDSAGDLLPFSQFGGMAIGVRATILRGIAHSLAFASTIVDVTLEMISQIVFVIAGLAILALHLPEAASQASLVKPMFVGMLMVILAGGAFFVMQRRGPIFLERIARRFLPSAVDRVTGIVTDIDRIHSKPTPMVAAFAVHLMGWLSSAFGTWLALKLVHASVAFSTAIAIEGLLCAVRSAAIVVPGAIGIQEAGYAMVMPLFGLTPEIGIAISLLKRAREIAVGVPVLLSWQIAEGNRTIRARGETA